LSKKYQKICQKIVKKICQKKCQKIVGKVKRWRVQFLAEIPRSFVTVLAARVKGETLKWKIYLLTSTVSKNFSTRGERKSWDGKKTFDRNVGRRAARFFLVHDTKNGKNVPNEHKIYQMVI
jgi:hypothetical protein